MTITERDLARIEAYCAAATPYFMDEEGTVAAGVPVFYEAACTDLPALVAAYREAREALKVALELLQGFDFATDASEDTAEEICERFKADIQETMLTEGGSLYHAARSIRVSLEPAPSKPNERRHREPVERVSSGPSVH